MKEKIVISVLSAVIGGVVGALVVFTTAGKTQFENLEVGNLTVTKQAKLLNDKGEDDIILRDGSVLANNVILGKKFIGTQYQGHVFVGNRMFTSPDDLTTKPMNEWRFYTEIGGTEEFGGEMLVRSPSGASIVGKQSQEGNLFRVGFDPGDNPQIFARSNKNGAVLTVPFARLPNDAPGTATDVATKPNPVPKPAETKPNPVAPTVAEVPATPR